MCAVRARAGRTRSRSKREDLSRAALGTIGTGSKVPAPFLQYQPRIKYPDLFVIPWCLTRRRHCLRTRICRMRRCRSLKTGQKPQKRIGAAAAATGIPSAFGFCLFSLSPLMIPGPCGPSDRHGRWQCAGLVLCDIPSVQPVVFIGSSRRRGTRTRLTPIGVLQGSRHTLYFKILAIKM